ncbi:MAG: ubiquinone anaerobic biosynthesis protein UbiV [Magnetospiraceae bacterium]
MSGKLTMGPVLFNWDPEEWRDFYFRVADEADVDTVCVGETVCSKRTPFFTPFVPEVIERLEAAGKEVIVSTLALIMTEREMAEARCTSEAADEWFVEANDISVAGTLTGKRHAIGPLVNIYNENSLQFLVQNGATRFCLPPELPKESLAALAKVPGAELEVVAFGRLPLAVSARCYHARSHKLQKENCQYVCNLDPDGMDLDTIDGDPFLTVNGIQTMSYTYCNLIGDLDDLREIGINRVRLSPHSCDMVRVAALFRGVMNGTMEAAEAEGEMAELVGYVPFSNGFFHGKEGVRITGALAQFGEETE